MTMRLRRPALQLDALLLTAAVCTWWISGAYFWQLALAKSAMLPILPQAIWIAPGTVWGLAPAVAAAIPLAALIALSLRPKFHERLRAFRWWTVAWIFVNVLVALVWGGALMLAKAGALR